MSKKIFIICVEKSGDIISSEVIQNLLYKINDFEIIGIFGKSSEEVCLKNNIKYSKLFDIEKLSVMGFVEVLPKLFSIIRIIKATARKILEINPDLVVTIDGYDFCTRVVKKVIQCNHNIKFFHIVAPTVWAYNNKRVKIIQEYYKALFCLLPFEVDMFKNNSLKTYFIGYPAVYKNLQQKIEYNDYLANNFKPTNRNQIISITLGSRVQENKRHFIIIKNVIKRILEHSRNVDFFILSTPELMDQTEDLISNFEEKISVISDEVEKINIAKKSSLIIAKSGTNTMEFVAMGLPLIVYYNLSIITMFVILKVKKLKIRLVNLFNIYKNKEIIPEFVFNGKCNSEDISKIAIEYLSDENKIKNQLSQTSEIVKFTRERHPCLYVAEIIVDFLK